MSQWTIIHMPQFRIISPGFWQREDKSYQTGGYLPFTVPVGVNVLPYEKLRGMEQDAQHPGYLLSAIAKDICEARGLINSADALVALYLGNQDVITYDEDAPLYLRYVVKPGDIINVGVLGGSRIRNRYALYKDVKKDIETQVKANIVVTKKDLNIFKWMEKVKSGGEWDYKENKMKAPIFPPDFRYWNYSPGAAKSSFFYMDKFTYNNTQPNLLRYDDVANINYGATGKHLKILFKENMGIHLQILLVGGGVYQQWTDAKAEWKHIQGEMKFIFNATKAYLDISALSFVGNAYQFKIPFLKQVSAFNEKMAKMREKGERNLYGDDPRDSYAIEWGHDNF